MKEKLLAVLLAFGTGFLCRASEVGPSKAYQVLWTQPEIVRRIDDGIRTNRMDGVVLKFTSADGLPMTNVTAQVEQTSHDFLFGANIFMLGGFPTPEENAKFEQAYTSIFNYATVPFYWSTLEPESGKPRFSKDSPPIYRRPPPDTVVEFCRQHGIAMKGHPLVYAQFVPPWMPKDTAGYWERVEQHIGEIAGHYSNSIPRWEVVNESLERDNFPEVALPDDFVFRSLTASARVFPANSILMLNEATEESWWWFKGKSSPYYRLIRELLGRGARVDEIGFQFHVMKDDRWPQLLAGNLFAPANIFRVLDQYADFGRPLAITEITFPTLPSTPKGEREQAIVVRNFYRLWFSHPGVNAISWWNLVDGTAHGEENRLNAGLLLRDFTPKPAFTALDQLINHDWKTKLETNSAASGKVVFRGFHGDYTVTALAGGKTVKQTFHLKKDLTPNVWNVRF